MVETHNGNVSSEQGNSSPHSGPKRSSVPAYASLLPYGNAALVAANAAAAVARGFQSLKLHEVCDESEAEVCILTRLFKK